MRPLTQRLRWPAYRPAAGGHANPRIQALSTGVWLVFPDSRVLSRAKRGSANVANRRPSPRSLHA